VSALPVIDVAPLVAGDPAGSRAVAAAIGRAAREAGFFYVRGHGVAAATIDRAFAEARRFFARPPHDKAAVSIERSRHNRGYVALGGEALDPARGRDMKEAFNIGLELPPGDPEIAAGAAFRGPNFWPDLPGWRAVMLDYYDRLWAAGRMLHRAFALDLGLDAGFFEPALDRPLATLRLLHYPPRDGAAGLGAGEHTDYGNVTLLATDGVAGLEVRRRDGGWIAAPAIPGAFVCNIGDCLMRWSNDVYVSTPHRVANPPGQDRYSIAFFLDANPDAEVACLPTCRAADRPPRYPPITAGAYLAERLDATYAFRAEAR